MTASLMRRCSPCVMILLVVAFCQLYVLITHEVVTDYIQSRLSALSSTDSPRSPHRPLYVLLLSYSRTGSSFFGDLLHSNPDAFYHYEPLHFISADVLNSSFHEARQFLSKLFQCQASQVPGYLSWHKNHKNAILLRRNGRHWKICSAHNACFNATFLDSHCSKHSVVLIKTIRLNLKEASRLFNEFPQLNLKIVYLVRDPRGTMNSRMKEPVTEWCLNDPLCYDPKEFCRSLEGDAGLTCELLASRPKDFTIVRYEDLAEEPYVVTNRLTTFLGFSRTKEMEEFISSHTSATESPKKTELGLDIAYSTFRNSVTTAMKWRRQMPFEKVLKIQKDCARVLEWLGYHAYITNVALKSNVNFDEGMHKSIRAYCRKEINSQH